MKFYKIILKQVPNEHVLEYAYTGTGASEKTIAAIRSGQTTLAERIGDGICPDCGGDKWVILSTHSAAVREGGKAYIECAKCGHITHL
jgi:predicted RNA-binding Zn-ribbon protein involved in translation (DUF1610 family)